MTFVKRPGFEREEVNSIDDTVFTDTGGDKRARVSSYNEIPSNPTGAQQQVIKQELLKVELLRDIRTELRRAVFLLERISGVEIDEEPFDGRD